VARHRVAGEVATVAQSEQFLTAYERASGTPGPTTTSEQRGRLGCGPAPSTPRRPASSARIPPPHSPRLKLRNEVGSADCDQTRPLKEIGVETEPSLALRQSNVPPVAFATDS
jgi:hypothetical protein